MNQRKSQPRRYSAENVKITCKAIFDLGRSVNYKGEYDPLKEGLWVPTWVWLHFTLVLGLTD